MIQLVEISLFRKLCSGFGLSLSLVPRIKVDVDFVAETRVKSTIGNPSTSLCQSLFKTWSPLLFPNMSCDHGGASKHPARRVLHRISAGFELA